MAAAWTSQMAAPKSPNVAAKSASTPAAPIRL
jgi:hypothetical protein